MPVQPFPDLRLPRPDGRATLRTMPGTSVPVIHQPLAPGDPLPFWAGSEPPDSSYLFDTDVDPDESQNRVGERVESSLVEALSESLGPIGAPRNCWRASGSGSRSPPFVRTGGPLGREQRHDDQGDE